MRPQLKIFLGAVLVALGVYWYALTPGFSSASNLEALVLAFQAVFGITLFIIGFFTVWINSDELRIQEEIEQADFEPEEFDTGDEFAEDDETVELDVDYESLVDGTIEDVKATVEENDVDLQRILRAEKENKDRKTLKRWLESRIGG